jgi:hypothetical protein
MDNDDKKDGRGNAPGSFGTRIKPGEVKNPKGRPKGAKGVFATAKKALMRQVEWQEKGKKLKGPLFAAFMDACVKQGMHDVKFAQMVMTWIHYLTNRETFAERDQIEAERYQTMKKTLDVYELHESRLFELTDDEQKDLIAAVKEAKRKHPMMTVEELCAKIVEAKGLGYLVKKPIK